MSARVGAYYAKDGWVRKRSERAANPDGSTTYTFDFRVCRMADEVGDEAADTVAALMNLGETAQSELATLRAEVERLREALGRGEQSAFEAWAMSEGFDMAQHPLHYLFQNTKTYAARKAWIAAVDYVRAAALEPTP